VESDESEEREEEGIGLERGGYLLTVKETTTGSLLLLSSPVVPAAASSVPAPAVAVAAPLFMRYPPGGLGKTRMRNLAGSVMPRLGRWRISGRGG
jgi:hypothetical protein